MHIFYSFLKGRINLCVFSFLLYFDCPLLQVFIDSSTVDILCDRWHYIIVLSFCIYTNYTFLWVSEISFLLEPAYQSLRNCTICQQFLLFNICFEFLRGLFSVLQDFGIIYNWGVRTLHPWLQRKWEKPVRVGSLPECVGKSGFGLNWPYCLRAVYRVHPHTLSHPTPVLERISSLPLL